MDMIYSDFQNIVDKSQHRTLQVVRTLFLIAGQKQIINTACVWTSVKRRTP